MGSEGRRKGIIAALSSAFFLGMVPIFGKLAFRYGFSPLAVIGIRSTVAALLMLALMLIKWRPFFYLFPVGIIGCLMAGFFNGLGSILYYTALNRLDAGIGHMLYSFYPLFVALWLILERQPITRLTIFRLGITIPAIILLVLPGQTKVDPLGAIMMLGSALLYALHMIINQRILYEAPAQTVTFYTLASMAVTVDVAFLVLNPQIPVMTINWWPVVAMALITFFSRITLFMGIKHLGGLQTSLLGLAELVVTVLLAQVWLGEHLSVLQWIGAAMLIMTMTLIGFEKGGQQKRSSNGWLAWLNPPKLPSSNFPWSSRL